MSRKIIELDTIVTNCVKFLPADSLGSSFSLGVYSVLTNGKELHF